MHHVWGMAVALVLCFAGFHPAAAVDWKQENNTNRGGSDYRNFEIVPRAASIAGDGVAERCEEACKKDSRCKAWTAVKAGLQGKNARCWLKTGVPQARADNCCTSGYSVFTTTGGGTKTGGSSGGSTSGAKYSNKILEYARGKVGSRIGDGECTRLVEGALAFAGAPAGKFPSNGDYSWGRQINFPTEAALPGDIIQLVKVKLSYKDANGSGSWSTGTQHSAVIDSVNGKVLQVIEQNAPIGSGVAKHQLNLNWKLESGFYKIYRP
jgi:hypothetical protein